MTVSVAMGLFGVCMLLSWGMTLSHLLARGAMIYTDGPLRAFQRPGLPRTLALALGTLAVLGSISGFVLTQSVWAGVTFLVVLGAFRQWERSQWTDDKVVALGKYVPTAAVLLAFLVGRGVAQLLNAEDPAHLGWQVGCGAMGATFSMAALSKWKKVGAEWFKGGGVQLLISERAFLVPEPVRSLRAWFGASPRLCTAMSAGAFVLEACGILFCVPQLRWAFFACAAAMVLGFWVLLGYWEIEWGLVLLALTLLSLGAT